MEEDHGNSNARVVGVPPDDEDDTQVVSKPTTYNFCHHAQSTLQSHDAKQTTDVNRPASDVALRWSVRLTASTRAAAAPSPDADTL